MPKKQTRRSLSVKGLTYQRLADYCKAEGVSVSGFIEELVGAKLDELGVERPTVLRLQPYPERRKRVEEIISQQFTF